MLYCISSHEDSEYVFRNVRRHWQIEKQIHYRLDVYLGEEGWSTRGGEAVKNMELVAKFDLFVLQRPK